MKVSSIAHPSPCTVDSLRHQSVHKDLCTRSNFSNEMCENQFRDLGNRAFFQKNLNV